MLLTIKIYRRIDHFRRFVGDLVIQLMGKGILATGLSTLSQTKVQIYPNPNEGHFTMKLKMREY